MAQMKEIKENVSNWNDETEVLNYLKKILRKEAGDGKGLIYGMGHAVYTISDPRTGILKRKAEELAEVTGHQAEFALYDMVQRLAPRAFLEEKGLEKDICANVDFYSGFVYQMMGLPEELYTPLFAMARIVGWSAHRIEEVMTSNRIIRPAFKTIAKRKSYTPIDEREELLPED